MPLMYASVKRLVRHMRCTHAYEHALPMPMCEDLSTIAQWFTARDHPVRVTLDEIHRRLSRWSEMRWDQSQFLDMVDDDRSCMHLDRWMGIERRMLHAVLEHCEYLHTPMPRILKHRSVRKGSPRAACLYDVWRYLDHDGPVPRLETEDQRAWIVREAAYLVSNNDTSRGFRLLSIFGHEDR
jgi:hypothetical protein